MFRKNEKVNFESEFYRLTDKLASYNKDISILHKKCNLFYVIIHEIFSKMLNRYFNDDFEILLSDNETLALSGNLRFTDNIEKVDLLLTFKKEYVIPTKIVYHIKDNILFKDIIHKLVSENIHYSYKIRFFDDKIHIDFKFRNFEYLNEVLNDINEMIKKACEIYSKFIDGLTDNK